MFTGLVEGLAEIGSVVPEGSAIRLSVRPGADAVASSVLGESVAINGCCLTVVSLEGGAWTFQAGFETLAKTNLGKLVAGDRVNWERALCVGSRLGGHFVQGHIDGEAVVDAVVNDGEWLTMWFRVPPRLARLMIPKGSIAVDGVSLTLVDVEPERFSVMLIPHTLQATTLGLRRVGDSVNIENDMLGKYVQKLLESPAVEERSA